MFPQPSRHLCQLEREEARCSQSDVDRASTEVPDVRPRALQVAPQALGLRSVPEDVDELTSSGYVGCTVRAADALIGVVPA